MICNNCGRENPPGAAFCANCGARLVPWTTLVPGVGSSFSHGWKTLRKNFWELVLAGVIYIALLIPVFAVMVLILYFTMDEMLFFDVELSRNLFRTASWAFQLASGILGIVYYLPLALGVMYVYLTPVRGEKVKYRNMFAAFQNYPAVVLVGFFYTLISSGVSYLLALFVGQYPILSVLLSLAWVVFGIFILCKLAFVPYLLVDRRMKAIEAITTGWKMSAGHAGSVFVIYLLVFLMLIGLGIVALVLSLIFFWAPFVAIFVGMFIGGIGSIIICMWLLTSYTSLYHAVSSASRGAASATSQTVMDR